MLNVRLFTSPLSQRILRIDRNTQQYLKYKHLHSLNVPVVLESLDWIGVELLIDSPPNCSEATTATDKKDER